VRFVAGLGHRGASLPQFRPIAFLIRRASARVVRFLQRDAHSGAQNICRPCVGAK
jgi:hypothetical protein